MCKNWVVDAEVGRRYCLQYLVFIEVYIYLSLPLPSTVRRGFHTDKAIASWLVARPSTYQLMMRKKARVGDWQRYHNWPL